MPTQSKHASINISLIQAREALMTQFRPILNQANITDQQWRIIRLLAENGTLDFQDLANQACILRPSLTGILTRLEKAGLVVRLKPSNDQRRVFLKLTAEGEKLYEEIGEEVDERYDAIEEVLGREKMLLLKRPVGRTCQNRGCVELVIRRNARKCPTDGFLNQNCCTWGVPCVQHSYIGDSLKGKNGGFAENFSNFVP
ncbi:homoprotocatechuate degradation operon regulator, HpaR [Neisseria meningitidis 2005079]|nr:homoprotocatechuate degradation operon regulator, HpaR [Neisseria meningitidis 2005079]